MKPSWPWEWTGEEASVPTLERDGKLVGEPVYRVRVRGTEDLELAYEIVQPDGSADSFPVALRRAIGLVRLSGDDRNDRDLRLVQGSALDRLLSDKGLRSRMASELAKNDVKNELTTEAQTALKNLDTAFKRESLPRRPRSRDHWRARRVDRVNDRPHRGSPRHPIAPCELGSRNPPIVGARHRRAEPGRRADHAR